MLTYPDIRAAADRLGDHILQTPCVASQTLSEITGAQVFLKFENLQFTASFKERGACNRLQLLTAEEKTRGVVAMSAGNHAQGVAYHAQRMGLRAVIVMPRFTPGVKVERTRSFGAEVVLHGDTLEAARQHAYALAEQQQLTFIHPYDDAAVAAGQGTLALEMLAEQPDLDTLIVSVGGGGLIAGVATAAKTLKAQHPRGGRANTAFSFHAQCRAGAGFADGPIDHCRGHCRGHGRGLHPPGGAQLCRYAAAGR